MFILNYVKYGIIGILFVAAFGLYDYIITLQRDLATVRAESAQAEANTDLLEKEIIKQQRVIDQQQKDFEHIAQAKEQLEQTNAQLQKEYANLDQKFNKINSSGERRDIGSLAVQKTAAIQRIVNQASANALRCVEIAMGSPLTEKEQNATKKSEINSECPNIANPKYVQY